MYYTYIEVAGHGKDALEPTARMSFWSRSKTSDAMVAIGNTLRNYSHIVNGIMSMIAIRRVVSTRDEIFHEGGAPRAAPLLVGTIAVALENPYAGSYFDDILPFMEELKELGKDLAGRLVELLEVEPSAVEAYGKGAIVGVDGELEHGALWHQPGGWGMREVLGGTKAIVFSNKRVGPAGTRLHIPMGHVNAAYVRSHMSSAEVGMDDAPRPSEIVFALVMSTGPRIHARVGGLAASEIKGEDGQR